MRGTIAQCWVAPLIQSLTARTCAATRAAPSESYVGGGPGMQLTRYRFGGRCLRYRQQAALAAPDYGEVCIAHTATPGVCTRACHSKSMGPNAHGAALAQPEPLKMGRRQLEARFPVGQRPNASDCGGHHVEHGNPSAPIVKHGSEISKFAGGAPGLATCCERELLGAFSARWRRMIEANRT
jgi:hypothetical protein